MDIALLRTFVEVADAESFTRAARTLGTTTATVSRDVARLEAQTGSRLFHRSTRRVALSSSGVALYAQTATHVRALRRAVRDLPETQEEPAGVLKLTAPYDLAATVLGDILAHFSMRYPKVQVQAEFSSQPEDLAGKGYDVAIRGGSWLGADPSWTVRTLVPDSRIGFYASPDYLAQHGEPLALGDAAHHWLIVGALRHQLGAPAGLTPKVEANAFLFLCQTARLGGGVASLPAIMAEAHVASGALVQVLNGHTVSVGGMLLVYPAMQPLARKISAFRDFVVEAIASHPCARQVEDGPLKD